MIVTGKIDYARKTNKFLSKPNQIQGLRKDDIINMMHKFPEIYGNPFRQRIKMSKNNKLKIGDILSKLLDIDFLHE